jgi:hypothetical protein
MVLPQAGYLPVAPSSVLGGSAASLTARRGGWRGRGRWRVTSARPRRRPRPRAPRSGPLGGTPGTPSHLACPSPLLSPVWGISISPCFYRPRLLPAPGIYSRATRAVPTRPRCGWGGAGEQVVNTRRVSCLSTSADGLAVRRRPNQPAPMNPPRTTRHVLLWCPDSSCRGPR